MRAVRQDSVNPERCEAHKHRGVKMLHKVPLCIEQARGASGYKCARGGHAETPRSCVW